MIAILGSILLVLYVFLPEFLFRKLAFNFRSVTRGPRARFEELISGAAASLLPFAITAIISQTLWFPGHWPFPVPEKPDAKYADYKTLISALCSDQYFHDHLSLTWQAYDHLRLHQARFLCWMYAILFLQIAVVVALTYYFGSLSRYRLYRWTFGRILLGQASHWEVLLTGFAFPRKHRPQIVVDAMTTDDHLYAGTVSDYFLRADGELSGVLLTDFKRFRFKHLEDDRKSGLKPHTKDYWTRIPGKNLYLPAQSIANLNIRYEATQQEFIAQVHELVKELDLQDLDPKSLVVTMEPSNASSGKSPTEHSVDPSSNSGNPA